MNQIALSDDLNVITAEIIAHKEMLSINALEIGARLKHVKENDLVHGQWENYCNDTCGISPRNARRYVRIYERFGNRTHVSEMSIRKMDMLAEFDDEELETLVTLPDGQEKKPIDMSATELKQWHKEKQRFEMELKVAKGDKEKAENTARHWESKWRQEANKQPQVVTKTVEKIPNDYQKIMEDHQRLNNENVQLQRTNQQLSNQVSESKSTSVSLKKLREYCTESIRTVSASNTALLFELSTLEGNKEAHKIADEYGSQLSEITEKFFKELKKSLELQTT